MDFVQLEAHFKETQSLRLLRADNAPLAFALMSMQFKARQQFSVRHTDLTDALHELIEDLRERGLADYAKLARDYLTTWANEWRALRIYRGDGDQDMVELTQDAERALRWLEELEERPFVGTESRLLSIFDTLEDIVANTTEDPAKRLEQLRRQRDELDVHIAQIEATGRVERFSDTQIRERFMQASDDARRLISDFAQVEANFRGIARQVQEAQLTPDLRRGAVIGHVLDANETLTNSDEGRSFRAFWQILASPDRKDRFNLLLDDVHALPEVEEQYAVSHLRGLVGRLLHAGQKIVTSNRRLAEQLRRLLDEQQAAESQRVRVLLTQLLQCAHQVAQQRPTNPEFFMLEGPPSIALPLERPFWHPPLADRYTPTPVVQHIMDLDEAAAELALAMQNVVDEQRLRDNLMTLLEKRTQVTLAAVLQSYPIERGVAEVLAYVGLALRDARHLVDAAAHEYLRVPVSDTVEVRLRAPRVVFRRAVPEGQLQ